MVTTCSCGILGGVIDYLSNPICIVLKFFKMFCGCVKKIWGLFF